MGKGEGCPLAVSGGAGFFGRSSDEGRFTCSYFRYDSTKTNIKHVCKYLLSCYCLLNQISYK